MLDFLSPVEEESNDFPDPACGYDVRTTKKGWRVITLHFWAIPERRKPSWRANKELVMGKRKFSREFLLDWDTAEGSSYYPEFAELGRDKFIHTLSALPTPGIACTLFRGLDFGGRRPACIWGVYSHTQDRLWILREFITRSPLRSNVGDGLATHFFRDIVRFYSGDLPFSELDDRGKYWVDWQTENGYPEGPWFGEGIPWENFTGPETNTFQANAAKDPRDATSARIFATAGIELTYQAGPVKARHEIFRRFLEIRSDGYPGVLIDPSCHEILAALGGAFTFAKETAANQVPDRPRKDGHYDNLMDALTYAVCAICPSVHMPLPRKADVGQYLPPSTSLGQEESIGWYGTEARRVEEGRPWVVAP